jgi:hypothetical protein
MAQDSRYNSGGTGSTELSDLDSERERAAADELALTNEERALLSDPEWIDEDEADAIIAMRIEQAEAGRTTPIREYMRERASRSQRTK